MIKEGSTAWTGARLSVLEFDERRAAATAWCEAADCAGQAGNDGACWSRVLEARPCPSFNKLWRDLERLFQQEA